VARLREEEGNAAIATSTRRRIGGVEGLRAVAALAIVLYHVWGAGPRSEADAPVDLGASLNNAMLWLQSGVTLFFVLSGFLLFGPFARAVVAGTPRPAIGQYFVNRALRILPLYWVVLAFTAIVVDRALLSRPSELLANIFLVQIYLPGLTGSDYHAHGIIPAWSLCVEAAFYALLPLLGLAAVALARRLRPRVAVAVPIVGMAVTGLLSLAIGAGIDSPLFNHGLPIHAAWFAVGMTVALVWASVPPERTILTSVGSRAGLALVAVALAPISLKLWTSGTLTFEAAQTVMSLGCGLLLALVVFAPRRSRLLRLLETRPAVAAGAASYGIFLWNEPILRGLRTSGLTLDGATGLAVNSIILVGITVVVSLASYRLVERPCLALKRNWRMREAADGTAPTYAATQSG
jgi:peptidoglycan/LPS O-acetylase OafA/YrhL